MVDTPFFVTLKNRGLISISGEDRHAFLQSLVTNDVTKVKTDGAVYACLLTPQGKFLHDFFIFEDGDRLCLDCEGGDRAEDLAKRLNIYKMRRDVEVSLETDVWIFSILSSRRRPGSKTNEQKDSGLRRNDMEWKDPRHSTMGFRTLKKPDLPEQPFEIWDERRIRLTIPDGSRDMIPEKSTLLECGIDKLNGIDVDKGCYIGQELTARMHYRGLVKKRLYTVEGKGIHDLPDLRSTCGDVGIALIRDKDLNNLPDKISVIPTER